MWGRDSHTDGCAARRVRVPGANASGPDGLPAGARRLMRAAGAALMAAVMAGDLIPAHASDLTVKPVYKAPPPPPPSAPSFWIAGEYLIWSAKGDKLPALVTTSPPGTPQPLAGVLGAPGTSVLFGNGRVNDDWRSGARIRGGYWFDPQHTSGIEAHFFMLATDSTKFSASSNGSPILARPFVNTTTGLEDALLVAFPGVSSGSVGITDTSRLLGAGAAWRTELCRACAFGSVSGLVGYRFLRLRDNLMIGTDIRDVVGGAAFADVDQFKTTNSFNGLDLGLTGNVLYGPWEMMWVTKVGVGGTFSDVTINGQNTVVPPGGGAVTTAGGFLALPTNIGTRSTSHFAVVPELGVNVSYHVTSNLRVFAGYSFLYWTGLVRPGGAIDTTINPSQLSGGALAGPARPVALFGTTDYWAQGFNFGLGYSF